MSTSNLDRVGFAAGAGAYVAWGLVPLYFALLSSMSSLELVAHRIVWSTVFLVFVITVYGRWRRHLRVWRDRRALAGLFVASLLVTGTWITFVYAVHSGHTVDVSLGHFINPIVTVLLAVFVLGERLRGAQWVAVAISGLAVIVIWVGYGRLPWIAFVLAVTFGCYGLVKNRIGRRIPAVDSLMVECVLLTPAAIVFMVWLYLRGNLDFGSRGIGHMVLAMSAGVITGVPLLWFGMATRRIPLRYVGMLQYIEPIMQLLVGVLIFHEPMPTARWAGFALVWVAVIILLADSLSHSRSQVRIESRGKGATIAR